MTQQNHKMPWATMFRCAVVLLGVRPQDFWRMTMKEFCFLLDDPIKDNNAISRQQLNELIKRVNQQ